MDALAIMIGRLRQNRTAGRSGITSICSANPLVLEAAMRRARADGTPVLIEATCNQVNQEGGYTGQTPSVFRDRLYAQADAMGLPREMMVLGGDHLGPNPWRHLPPDAALARARALVASFAAAGYRKLHLDSSMACAGETEPLPSELIADRAADLAAAAERALEGTTLPKPIYVIGTEVPTPGGAHGTEKSLTVTEPDEVGRTMARHEAAFRAIGGEAAFERVLAVVVQPGVEFGDAGIHDFAAAAAAPLAAALTPYPSLVFEAHSTDYQRAEALGALIANHFAILKVGPELTFALREAVFGLEMILGEREGTLGGTPVRDALSAAMAGEPRWWRGYYDPADSLARLFSLSDRIRYYWSLPAVQAALDALCSRLDAAPIPPTLVSQYLPGAYAEWRARRFPLSSRALIRSRIDAVLTRYARACGP